LAILGNLMAWRFVSPRARSSGGAESLQGVEVGAAEQ